MKAIILAAGYGRRMKPLTDSTHKTLLAIAGDTILGRLMSALVANDVEEIVVVTGYRAGDIESYLRSTFPEVTLTFISNERYAETNNVYSMALALEQSGIDDDFILIESDLVCDPLVLRDLIDNPAPNVALVDRYRPGMDGTVVRVTDGVITEVIPPHLQSGEFSFADTYKTLNVYKFSRDFCNSIFRPLVTYYARSVDDNSYYELILGILIYLRRAVIKAQIVDKAHWAEVDDPNDLSSAQFTFDPTVRRMILEQRKGGYWAFDVLDFAYLRNMYFPTPAVLAQLRDALPQLVQNYGSSQGSLNEKLAYFLLCATDRLQVLNGASQIFPWLKERFRQKRILLPTPTFMEWHAAFPDAQHYEDQVGVDQARLEEAFVNADVLVIVSPNNPTGTTLPSASIVDLARRNPGKTIVVDQSFQGFSNEPSMVDLLEESGFENIVVIASLSKTLGMPGVRMGYVYSADADLITEIGKWLPIWNLNSVAEHVLELVLKHRPSIELSYELTRHDRSRLADALRRIGFVDRVYEGGGNFLLAALDGGSRDAYRLTGALLERHSIYVKDVSERFAGERGWLRIAVRLPAENHALLKAMAATEPAWDLPVPVAD